MGAQVTTYHNNITAFGTGEMMIHEVKELV